MKDLCVVTSFFNPCGYRRSERNFERFLHCLVDRDVPFIAVRLEYNSDIKNDSIWYSERSRLIELPGSRERSVMFQKEALLNVGLREAVKEYDAVAWIDADVIFLGDDWEVNTLRELEKFDACQMFSQCHWLDKDDEIYHSSKSTGLFWSTRDPSWSDLTVSHPGFAWAARSELIKDSLLYPYGITGCGDTLMLRGLLGEWKPEWRESIGEHNATLVDDWARSMPRLPQTGFVMGAVAHMYHGTLQNRHNLSRRRWLLELDERHDLRLSEHGILEWTDFALRNKARFVGGIRDYFASRKEDD